MRTQIYFIVSLLLCVSHIPTTTFAEVTAFAQATSLFQCCPICEEDWFPVPFSDFRDFTTIKRFEKIDPVQNLAAEAHCAIKMFWTIQCSQHMSEQLPLIMDQNSRLYVVVLFPDMDGGASIIEVLKQVPADRFVSLELTMPNYNLSSEDIDWIVSLKNLRKLSLQLNEVSVETIKHILGKINLTHFNWVPHRGGVRCFLGLSDADINDIQNTSRDFFYGISNHATLKYLAVSSLHFSVFSDWHLPRNLKTIKIFNSGFSFRKLEILSDTPSLRHITLSGFNFPIMNESLFFHENIRCLELMDIANGINGEFSRLVLINLHRFPNLRFLSVNIGREHLLYVEESMHQRNIIRVLLLPTCISGIEADLVIQDIRRKYSIYADYRCSWNDNVLFRDSIIRGDIVSGRQSRQDFHPASVPQIQLQPDIVR